MLDARVFWNQYFANQTGHLGRSNGLMMTLVTDWEEALMLRRYMWFGWGSCSFPLWRHGHKHSHTNTVSGDDMPKPLRVQSSNNVVMSKRSNGSKTSYCSEIWRENKAVFFCVKSAVTFDLYWPSTSQEHHPRPFRMCTALLTPSDSKWFQSIWGAGELPWCYSKVLTTLMGQYCCWMNLATEALQGRWPTSNACCVFISCLLMAMI